MRILNFGSLNLDNVYHVEHFVKPSETISSSALDVFCGGKGLNQSVALARAGATVFHAGKIDNEGEILIQTLKQSGVDISFIKHSKKVTGHAIIQLDSNGQNCIILHGGANRDIDEEMINEVLLEFQSGDILLLQNEINNIPLLMQKASKKGMLIAFNPSPIDRQLKEYPLELVKWFILNEIEGFELTDKKEPWQIADTLLQKYPNASIVLTLGENGVVYRDLSQFTQHGIFKVKVIDTTAAGDTFTGYFLAAVALGAFVKSALRRAAAAAAICVSRMGASDSIPTAQEVDDFLSNCCD
jgi:ribokinase